MQRPQDKSRRPSARYGHAALDFNYQSAPSMLVVGGYNQKQASDDVWQFDLGSSTASSWLPSAGLLSLTRRLSHCAENRKWDRWDARGTAGNGLYFHAAGWAGSHELVTLGGRDGQSSTTDTFQCRTLIRVCLLSFAGADSSSFCLISCACQSVTLNTAERGGKYLNAGGSGRQLPDEVMMLIFSYLTDGIDLTHACLVCKRFVLIHHSCSLSQSSA